jgi:hypothetical protein
MSVYHTSRSDPLLMAEVLERFAPLIEDLAPHSCNARVLEFLGAFGEYYRSMSAPPFRDVVALVQSRYLTLLVRLLETHVAQELVWPRPMFLSFFFEYLRDPTVRPVLAPEAIRVLGAASAPVCGNAIVSVATMILDLSGSIDHFETLQLAVDLIAIITKLGENHPDVSSFTNPTLRILFQLVSVLNPGPGAELLLFKFLECFAVIGRPFQFLPELARSLSSALRLLFGDEMDNEELRLNLLKCLRCSLEEPLAPNFGVVHEESLKLLVRLLLLSRSFFSLFFPFLLGLLRFSLENIHLSHHCGIDLMILKHFRELKINNDPVDSNRIDTLCSVFAQISKHMSSPRIVKDYISLFVPIEERFISYHHALFAQYFTDILKGGPSHPSSPRSAVVVFDSPSFSGGVSFTFWVKFTRDPGEIVSLSIGSLSWEVIISDCRMAIKSDSIHAIAVRFEPQVWSFVVIALIPHCDSITIFPQIDSAPHASFQIPRFSFQNATATITRAASPRYCEFGRVGIVPLLADDAIKSHMVFYPLSPPDLPSSRPSDDFASSLFIVWKVDVIIPLFNILGVPFADGSLWPGAFSFAIEVLSLVLVSSPDVQAYFQTRDYFRVISACVQRSQPSNVNFAFYLSFFSLFRTLDSDSIRRDLLTTVLINAPLWSMASPPDRISIVRHWRTVLFPMFPLAREVRPFDQMLTFALIYHPSHTMYVRQRAPTDDGHVTAIRDELHFILLSLAAPGLSRSAFYTLFSYATSFSDLSHSLFVIFLLRAIITEHPNSFTALTAADVLHLRYLLVLGSPELSADVLGILIEFHKRSGSNSAAISHDLEVFLAGSDRRSFDHAVFSRFLKLE